MITFAPDDEPQYGWWHIVGCSLMQFKQIATPHFYLQVEECGIEYGCQFVTQIFVNPPDCLYTKKAYDFLQSYEKTKETQEKLQKKVDI